MTPLINLNNLTIRSSEATLLAPLSLALYHGRPLTILGQTGSGKSLLAQAIMGLLPASLSSSGTVEIQGRQRSQKQLEGLWGSDMVMLPQEPWNALDPLMPCYQQLIEVHQLVGGKSFKSSYDSAVDDLHRFDLYQHGDKLPQQLSGGMAQRLAVAVATAGGAQLLLADEPTKGLDVSRRDDVIALLQQSAVNGGLLTITHDVEVALKLGGDAIVMNQGKVVERGPIEQLCTSPTHPYTKALIAAQPKCWPVTAPPLPRRKPLLDINKLAIGRNGNLLASDIDFTLHQGEILGVVGDSGCGKSTLGDTLLGLLAPLAGSVTKIGNTTESHQWLKLYQDPPAAFTTSVNLGTLVDDILKLHDISEAEVAPLMSRLNLSPELLKRPSNHVSGGELQRFAILRALLLKPVFLFADEPTSRLDPITAQEVIGLLVEVAREQACAVVLVSHDPMLIEKVCDRTLRLKSH